MAWFAGRSGKRGRSATDSEAAIQFCLSIKCLFGRQPRQSIGLVESLLKLSGLDCRVVGFQIHFLVLDGSPEPLDEDVVASAAFAVHADLDAAFLKYAGEFSAGELTALVGIEDVRLAVTGNGFLEGIDTEIRGQRVGEPSPVLWY